MPCGAAWPGAEAIMPPEPSARARVRSLGPHGWAFCMACTSRACESYVGVQVDRLTRILNANPEAVFSDGGGRSSSSGYTPLHYAARSAEEDAAEIPPPPPRLLGGSAGDPALAPLAQSHPRA